MFRDFLGQKLSVGDYLIYPGAGNRKAEYGLLLLKIKKLNPNTSITAERLDPYHAPDGKKILRKDINVKALTKVTRVQPLETMLYVFENAEKHYDLVTKWVHGKFPIEWENLDLKSM